jgi:catalase
MSKRKNDEPVTENLTGLDPSPADANRSEQAAAALAEQPGESLTTNRFAHQRQPELATRR